jgi:dipeptidyl aminopeptidase/acylaminoacyl peptidase
MNAVRSSPARFLSTLLTLLLSASLILAQSRGGEIIPPDSLAVEGVPKIPSSLADELRSYFEIRWAAFSSWHPTRREMLIRTQPGQTQQIHLLKAPGDTPAQLTFFDDPVSFTAYQPKAGAYFIFIKDEKGDQRYRNYRYDFETGKTTLITKGKTRETGGLFSNAGDRMIYTSARVSKIKALLGGAPVAAEIHVQDPLKPETDRVVTTLDGVGWIVSDWSPDDRKALLLQHVSFNERYLWLLDVASGEKRLLTSKNRSEDVFYGGGIFSKDGKGIYTTTDLGSEFQRLTYIDLETRQHTSLSNHIKWDIAGYTLSADGKTIAASANENGFFVLHMFDTKSGQEKPQPHLPAGSVYDVQWHKNSRDLGFTFVSARSTPDAYSLDTETGKLERWTTSATAGFDVKSFVEPEIVSWKSFDDRTISGLLYQPPAKFAGRRPVIIDIHGGPEDQAHPGFMGWSNYLLNELGIASIFPNVRGSAGYGKTFLKLDDRFLREDAYKDIGALLDWIKAQPRLDADRVMLVGASYGGHMTLAAATRYNERIRCSMPVTGPSNLVTFLRTTARWRRDLRRVEYGDERDPRMRDFLEKIAPVNDAQKITKPVFFIYGKNDPAVPLSEARQMVAAVRKNSVPVWYIVAKNEGHGFTKKRNDDFLIYAAVTFMKEYLLK